MDTSDVTDNPILREIRAASISDYGFQSYLEHFADYEDERAANETEPAVVSVFAGLPSRHFPRTEEIVTALLTALNDEGYIRKIVRSIPTPPTASAPAPRPVPTPQPKPIEETNRSIIEGLRGERLYIRSLWYDPSKSLRPRWEAIADDGADGEYPGIRVWLWEEDKERIVKSGYSAALFNKSVTRTLLTTPIEVTLRWSETSGAKLDDVLAPRKVA